MFRFFEKKLKKSELEKTQSFIEMLTNQFIINDNYHEFSEVDCPNTKSSMILSVHTPSSYLHNPNNYFYGCIKILRNSGENKNKTTNFIVEFNDKELFTVCKFDSLRESNNMINHDFSRNKNSNRGSEEFQQCLQIIKNTASFNGYTAPPPYFHALMMYRGAN